MRESSLKKRIQYRALTAFVCLLALGLLSLVSCGLTAGFEYTLEAGDPLPDAAELSGIKGAVYTAGREMPDTAVPGRYTVDVDDPHGQRHEVTLTIQDTRGPQGTVRTLTAGVGTRAPEAADFFLEVNDVSSWTATLDTDISTQSAGEFTVKLCLTDAYGNRSRYTTALKVIQDTTPPVFVELPELSAQVNQTVSYKKGVIAEDNCFGTVSISVDASMVDLSTDGAYPVYYTAVDASGNQTTESTTIWVHADTVTEDMLWAKVDVSIAQIIRPDMTSEEKCRAVYSYIQGSMFYMSDSDKNDWIGEAYRSMYVRGGGDCFSFYAVGRAFMERLGIPYKTIQRLPGYTEDTHYWMMVNIGTEESPCWYHYDVCRLGGEYPHSGCLLTDVQVNAYNRARPHFYEYDPADYPATSTAIITPTENLEPFYRSL